MAVERGRVPIVVRVAVLPVTRLVNLWMAFMHVPLGSPAFTRRGLDLP